MQLSPNGISSWKGVSCNSTQTQDSTSYTVISQHSDGRLFKRLSCILANLQRECRILPPNIATVRLLHMRKIVRPSATLSIWNCNDLDLAFLSLPMGQPHNFSIA